MKTNLLWLLLLLPIIAISQPNYKTIESKILRQKRDIKIQLPRNYGSNTEKTYPVIYVLDGDYLFEPVAGNVDYYSYWEDMPEAIVVGINQVGARSGDTSYDQSNYFPVDGGADFFEFLGMELMPLIDEEYRTAKFSIAVGHDITANFINYYLFKENPLFKGYINLSPDYAPEMHDRIFNALEFSEQKLWYYTATGSQDIENLREDIKTFNTQMGELTNELVKYYYNDFKNQNHYNLVGKAIPSALEQIFAIYRPVTQYDYQQLIADENVTDYYEYLENKYEEIKELYELEIKVRPNDILGISNAIIEKEKWDQLKDLAKLAEKEHPEKMLGNYLMGVYYEKEGKPKKAMKEYQSGYAKEKVAFLNQDYMIQKMDQIKADFGE
ncbi:alpha/beta hydrolase-fold protein [Mesonia sp.]|uniref:alpha/beta hydrolase-fold protein n=1 Tax=Mesonia sp. TaxID=1960830 RepID=UPI0017795F8E|nr:alpha/beta hydrolase-fold protein [Mesonia sp.]HIB36441.1 esterase [Mesonia sp.]HIO27111.1 esterase [Flavobacteriaceae bacterium]